MKRVVLNIAAAAAISGCGSAADLPSKKQFINNNNSACGTDCRGALPSDQCAVLDPTRFSGGTAVCTTSCSVDLSGCLGLAPKQEFTPCTGIGQGDCAMGLECKFVPSTSTTLCVVACDPVGLPTCGLGRICESLSPAPNDGGCFPNTNPNACTPPEMGLTRCNGTILESCDGNTWNMTMDCAPRACVAAGMGGGFACEPDPNTCTIGEAGNTRCSIDVLQNCNGANWLSMQDCSIGGGTCIPDGMGGFRCFGPGDCTPMELGNTRCAGQTLETCDGSVWQMTTDCTMGGGTCQPDMMGGFQCVGPAPCTAPENGDTRCVVDELQQCDGSNWNFVQDCSVTMEQCGSTGPMTFGCVPPACDFTGFVPSTQVAFYDDQLFPFLAYHTFESVAAGGEQLSFENWPGYEGGVVPPGSGSFDFMNFQYSQDYSRCGLCMLLGIDDAGTFRLFMPESGGVTVNAPQALGMAMTLDFTAVTLVEVAATGMGFETAPVMGGKRWCVNSSSLNANIERYNCSASFPEGSTTCARTSQPLGMSTWDQIWICSGGKVTAFDRCYLTGQQCDPMAAMPVCF